MPTPTRIYTRLTRPAIAVGSYKSLWLAADHLLIVDSSGYSEEYARIRFRDIKGLFVIPSNRRMGWGVSWGALAFLCALAFVITWTSGATPIASGIFLALTLLALIWNQLLGPSCRVFFVTGVQTAALPSIVRRSKARKILGKLEVLVRDAQSGPMKAPSSLPDLPGPGSPAL